MENSKDRLRGMEARVRRPTSNTSEEKMAKISPKWLKTPIVRFHGLVNSTLDKEKSMSRHIKMNVWKTDSKYSKYSLIKE